MFGKFFKSQKEPIKKTSWEPLSEVELWDLMNDAWVRMTFPQRYLWEAIQIPPEKWQLHPWGDLGGGFWVVGILGKTAVWYNDIEHGFNRSHYTEYGILENYYCNQDHLEWPIQHILNEVQDGYPSGFNMGPPQPLE